MEQLAGTPMKFQQLRIRACPI